MSEIALEELVESGVEVLEQFSTLVRLQDQTYKALLLRYDDLNKRCHDLQAELEYLRREVNR